MLSDWVAQLYRRCNSYDMNIVGNSLHHSPVSTILHLSPISSPVHLLKW